MGVGDDYNEDLMEAMARAGDGRYYYIESPAQLVDIFQTELQGLMETLGQKVSLGLKPKNGAAVSDVLNDFDKSPTGRLMLPNLVVDMPVFVVVRLKLPPSPAGTTPLEIRLAWDAPGTADGGCSAGATVRCRPSDGCVVGLARGPRRPCAGRLVDGRPRRRRPPRLPSEVTTRGPGNGWGPRRPGRGRAPCPDVQAEMAALEGLELALGRRQEPGVRQERQVPLLQADPGPLALALQAARNRAAGRALRIAAPGGESNQDTGRDESGSPAIVSICRGGPLGLRLARVCQAAADRLGRDPLRTPFVFSRVAGRRPRR